MKKIAIYIFIAFSLLLAAGCSIGKNYKRPDLTIPSAYRNQENSNDTSTVSDLAWKDFFSDTVLVKLIDKAINNNYDMLIAVQNIERARQVLTQSNAAFAPDIDARIGTSSNIPSANSLNGISIQNFLGTTHLEDFTLNVGLQWEIDIWGKLRRQKEAAKADYMGNFETVRAIQTTLVSQVAGAYYNLLMLDAQLLTAQKNLALNDTILQITQLMQETGSGTSLSVQLVLAQQQTAALLIPQLEQRILIQENALQILTGEWPGKVDRYARLENIVLSDQLSMGIPLQILSRRPDVRASELKLKADNARVGVAQASLYPALVINLSTGLNSFTAGNWFNIPGSIFGTFAGGLTQPLFRRRMLKTQVELAKIDREKSTLEFQKKILVAVGEVTDAMIKVQKLKEQQTIALNRVETLRKATNDAKLLFSNGMSTYLEVITAQSNLLNAELESSSIMANLYMAKVDLYRSLGGGWK